MFLSKISLTRAAARFQYLIVGEAQLHVTMEDLHFIEDNFKLEFEPVDPAAVETGELDSDSCPDDLVFTEQPFTIDFHPSRQMVAVGTVGGAVSLHRYRDEGNELVWNLGLHQAACRSVRFAASGEVLYSTGTDMALVMTDVETGSVVHHNTRAMIKPVSAMTTWGEDTGPGMVALGDEDGHVRIWDMRQPQTPVFEMHDNEDYIGELSYHAGRQELMASGGDGYLSVFKVRRGKLLARSDNLEDELLSAVWMRGGKTAVTGTQGGALNIWTAGDWGWPKGQLSGHPESVDALCKVDETTLVTGSSDGLLRLVSIQPLKLLGVVGEHGNHPIEQVRMSFDKHLLASCSHDDCVKFWNIDYLFEEDDDEDEEPDAGDEGAGMDLDEDDEAHDNRGKQVDREREAPLSKNKQKKAQFFSGLE